MPESLNLNWGYTPQQEQTLSVERSVDKVSNSINDMVRKKEESDKAYDNSLMDIVKTTSGKYQDELYGMIEESKQKIKAIGKQNWNSKDLRTTREEILRDLQSSSQKANYVATTVPQLFAAIKADKYIDRDAANAAVNAELAKGVKNIDINALESVLSNSSYKNVKAMVGDAAGELYKNVIASDPYSVTKNGMILTNQVEYSNAFEHEKDATGKKLYNQDGTPKLKSALTDDAVQRVFDQTGNPNVVYDHFEKLYEQTAGANAVPSTEVGARRKAVMAVAKQFISDVSLQPSIKNLGAAQPRVTGAQNALELYQGKKLLDEKVKEETILAIDKDTKENGAQILKNKITDFYKGASNIQMIKSTEDGFFKDKKDRVLSAADMEKLGYISSSSAFYAPTGGTKSKHKITALGKAAGIEPFSGIAFTINGDKGQKSFKAFSGDVNNDKSRMKLVRSVYDATASTTDVGYELDQANAEANAITPEAFNAQWSNLQAGESLVGPDGKTYTKK
jgi:hypothetical protein